MYWRFAILALAISGVMGCTDQPSPEGSAGNAAQSGESVQLMKSATAELNAELVQVLNSLDESSPGQSASVLSEFLARNRGYETDALVQREIERLRSLTEGRYHAARELARKGEFDQAESILVDLATHLPDTPDGEKAVEHLDFGFYMNRAQHLLMRQRFDEAAVIAQKMLELDLSPAQAAQAEQILDTVGHADAAFSTIERQTTAQATRQLLILLATRFVEDGDYPARFRLSDVEEWDPYGGRSILRSLSKIEGYRASPNSVSFTAVSKSGEHRIEVVDNEMKGLNGW